MVSIHIPALYRRSAQGSAHAVLRWNGKIFTEVALPKDIIPVRWAGDNRLICNVPAEATLQLTPDKKEFTRSASNRNEHSC